MKFRITKVYREKSEYGDCFNYYADIKFDDGETGFVCLDHNPSNDDIIEMATEAYNSILKARDEKQWRKTFLEKLITRFRGLRLRTNARNEKKGEGEVGKSGLHKHPGAG